MKKTDFIGLSLIALTLFGLAISLYFITNNAPTIFDTQKAQKAYNNSLSNPKSLSAKEVNTILQMHVKAQNLRHSAETSIVESIQGLAIVLATLAIYISLIIIIIYSREKHENS